MLVLRMDPHQARGSSHIARGTLPVMIPPMSVHPTPPARRVFSNDEIRRYSRHLLVPEIGVEGQRKLRESRVVCVGAGGLGSPVLMYLAAAGIGTLGLVECDVVEVSNLPRQILYTEADVGRSKSEAAASRLAPMNADVSIHTHDAALSPENARSILGRYDIVVDATDNFPARYLVSDVCVLLGKPDVSGSVLGLEGQVSVYGTSGGPCYRCVHPEPPPQGLVPTCAEAGVLGALPGIIGSILAVETVKLAAGFGEPLAGRLLLLDGLGMRFREVRVSRDPACPACGEHPTIHELLDYEAFCGTAPVVLAPELEIAASDLKAALDRGESYLLVDVREPQELTINAIPGSIAVPFGDLPGGLEAFGHAHAIVVYCRTGIRSAAAVKVLQSAGYSNVRHLTGGIESWIETVDPDLPRY